MEEIELKIKRIVNMQLDDLQVFKVQVWRNDHTDTWWAQADLRGKEGAFANKGDTIMQALNTLEETLTSLVCPTCKRSML